MSGGISYLASRAVVRRSSRRRRAGSRRSNGASTSWVAGWIDPAVNLGPGSTSSAEMVSNPEIRDVGDQVTLVGGFVQLAGHIYNNTTPTNPSAGYLIVGIRVLPSTIVDVAEMPDPFNESDGDWLYYRSFPLITPGVGLADGSESFMVNDQIRSARRVAADEEISMHYTFLDADYSAEDASVRFLASWRLLLRVP